MEKVYNSAELKTIGIVVPTALGELRYGHITRFFFGGMVLWCELFRKVSGSCAVSYGG